MARHLEAWYLHVRLAADATRHGLHDRAANQLAIAESHLRIARGL